MGHPCHRRFEIMTLLLLKSALFATINYVHCLARATAGIRLLLSILDPIVSVVDRAWWPWVDLRWWVAGFEDLGLPFHRFVADRRRTGGCPSGFAAVRMSALNGAVIVVRMMQRPPEMRRLLISPLADLAACLPSIASQR
ncbi:hypothetical protein ACLOJK_022336 [Asimina triloba]